MGQKSTKDESNANIHLIPSFEENNNVDYDRLHDIQKHNEEEKTEYICKLSDKTQASLVQLQCTQAHGAHRTHFVYFMGKSIIIANVDYIIVNDIKTDRVATFEASTLKYDSTMIREGVTFYQFATPPNEKGILYIRTKADTDVTKKKEDDALCKLQTPETWIIVWETHASPTQYRMISKVAESKQD